MILKRRSRLKLFKFIAVVVVFLGSMLVCDVAMAENSVGFAAGSTRGLGATYRYFPDSGDASPWGWQVTGLPIITPDSGTVSGGGALLYLLHRGDVALAYVSLGVGALVTWNECEDSNDQFCEDESHWGAGMGPGVGFELRLVDNLGWSVEIPLAFMVADSEFFGIYPVPNSSLVYYW